MSAKGEGVEHILKVGIHNLNTVLYMFSIFNQDIRVKYNYIHGTMMQKDFF